MNSDQLYRRLQIVVNFLGVLLILAFAGLLWADIWSKGTEPWIHTTLIVTIVLMTVDLVAMITVMSKRKIHRKQERKLIPLSEAG